MEAIVNEWKDADPSKPEFWEKQMGKEGQNDDNTSEKKSVLRGMMLKRKQENLLSNQGDVFSKITNRP